MSDTSAIEWTDATWPIVAGCEKVSSECKSCYAIRDSWRLTHNPNPKISAVYAGTVHKVGSQLAWTGLIRPLPDRLDWPSRWKKPRRIFVCNEADLFHPLVPAEFVYAAFCVMAANPWHTFQVLTKHARRARELLSTIHHTYDLLIHYENVAGDAAPTPALTWPLPNIWFGVSAGLQKTWDERVEELGRIPAAVRFVSAEPLLEEIDCGNAFDDPPEDSPYGKVNWVIAGGESGSKARPSHPAWFRSLRDQCQLADVPFFFKQWGEWRIDMDFVREKNLWDETRIRSTDAHYIEGHPELFVKVGKKAAGRQLDGREWNEYP